MGNIITLEPPTIADPLPRIERNEDSEIILYFMLGRSAISAYTGLCVARKDHSQDKVPLVDRLIELDRSDYTPKRYLFRNMDMDWLDYQIDRKIDDATGGLQPDLTEHLPKIGLKLAINHRYDSRQFDLITQIVAQAYEQWNEQFE